MFHLKINMKWKYRCRATGKQTWTQIMKKKTCIILQEVSVNGWGNSGNWMLMLASKQKRWKWKGHGCCLRKAIYIYIYISLDKSSSSNLLISVNFFKRHIPLSRKRPYVEKYFPFPRYKIKPTNGSECTIFHFDCHIDLVAPSKQM